MHVASDGTVLARLVPAGTEGSVAGTGAAVVPRSRRPSGRTSGPTVASRGSRSRPTGGRSTRRSRARWSTGRPAPSAPRRTRELACDPRVPARHLERGCACGHRTVDLCARERRGRIAGDRQDLDPDVGRRRQARGRGARRPRERPQRQPAEHDVHEALRRRLHGRCPDPAGSAWNGPAGAATGGKSLEQWYIPGQGTGAPSDLPETAPKCLWADVAALLVAAGFTDPNNPARAGNGKIEGVALVKERGTNPALLAVVNDNDFGLAVPIPEQIDVLQAPPLCTPS